MPKIVYETFEHEKIECESEQFSEPIRRTAIVELRCCIPDEKTRKNLNLQPNVQTFIEKVLEPSPCFYSISACSSFLCEDTKPTNSSTSTITDSTKSIDNNNSNNNNNNSKNNNGDKTIIEKRKIEEKKERSVSSEDVTIKDKDSSKKNIGAATINHLDQFIVKNGKTGRKGFKKPGSVTSSINKHVTDFEQGVLLNRVKEMFMFGYDSYMTHALPMVCQILKYVTIYHK
jgi:hypothetical protein